ncbi:MAG: cytochrome C [Rhodospirillaceae bacterium]|jgi:cytochrome c553|nr:cytochrome C [Rhodospirillaceae bacterium]MBT4218889.1 cytochrome C [Rhodospirillaceae bacterium]MBT5013033.1 cytochrome C [Rhodospirillaceae bacterium]MBT7356861.1 cytochrome C [Rhodospirillaceae bacterium]
MLVKSIVTLAVAATVLSSFMAQADERYRPVDDKVVIEECGACHMAFQPQMLPKKSWIKIMDGLSNHFGEDASLDEKAVSHIKKYHVEHAADSGWKDGKFMRGLSDSSAPLRITETPYWVREHRKEVPDWAWNDPTVKSKANCIACHKRGNQGDYDDD